MSQGPGLFRRNVPVIEEQHHCKMQLFQSVFALCVPDLLRMSVRRARTHTHTSHTEEEEEEGRWQCSRSSLPLDITIVPTVNQSRRVCAGVGTLTAFPITAPWRRGPPDRQDPGLLPRASEVGGPVSSSGP